jgi:N-dimethylarginine dimethylaminohydrolase
MTKYGLYSGSMKRPDQEFEGDYMTQNGQYVMIFKGSQNSSQAAEQVAAIHLDKGQSVKPVRDVGV